MNQQSPPKRGPQNPWIRLFALAAALFTSASLTACGSSGGGDNDAPGAPAVWDMTDWNESQWQ